mgnify:CR=1 FL=1
MSEPGKASSLRKLLLGSPTRKILLVEGPDDRDVYDKWLSQLVPGGIYTDRVTLERMGGKSVVLSHLEWFQQHNEPRVFGLVDRDEWDTATCQARRAALPNLLLNSERHALESYFCDPDEVFPAIQQSNPDADLATFREPIDSTLATYVCHWALLTTTDRLKNRMMEIGYPGQFNAQIPPPDDATIQTCFQQWANTLDPLQGFAEFNTLRSTALAEPMTIQFRRCVWAKRFFEQVVIPQLNALTPSHQRSAGDWMIHLAEFSPQVPADLAPLLTRVLGRP